MKLRKLTAALTLVGALGAAPMLTSTAQAQNVQAIEEIASDDFRTMIYRAVPLETVRPERGVVRLSVPPRSELVGVQRDKDGYEIAIGLRVGVDTNELFEYYKRLMAAQGFVPVSVDYDVQGGGYGLGDDYDAEHIQAVFARESGAGPVGARGGLYDVRDVGLGAGDRIDFLLDREGPYSYIVYASPQAYGGEGGYGVYGDPLYYGAGYGFYGPVGYEGYEGLEEDETRIRFVAPRDVTEFNLVQRTPELFRYRFRTQRGVEDIYNFYDRLFTEQGYQRVRGTLGRGGGDFIYANQAGERVGLGLDRVGAGLYEAEVDFGVE